MATRRRTQSNPFTSANLGSGARTTVGGSYENPRLGIQDYSAFGRGVASTFRLPKEQEIKELELPTIDYIGSLKDSMLGDAAWNENQSTVNQLYNDLIPFQAQYEKCQKANDQQCLRRIEGSLNIIQDGAAKWRNYLSKYIDDEVYDNETSRGQYMIDVNRKNIKKPDGSFLSLADITKVNNERPQDIKYALVNNKAVYQVKLDGQTYNVNLTDLTENYLNNSFDIRSNIGLDVQSAMASGGFTSDWKDEPTYMNETSKITTEKGLQNVTDFTDYKKIVEGLGYFNKAEDKSKVFSSNLYKTISSPNVNSAFHKLTAKIYNGFNTDSKYMPALEDVISRSKDLKSFRTQMSQISNDIKLEMLQDEAEQEWLIANASNGYRRGDNGRAERLDDKYLIKQSETKKPIDEETGGIAFGSFFSAQSPIEGLKSDFKRTIGEGTKDYEFKGNLVDLIDKDNIDVLQKQVTKLQPGTYIGKRDTLENMYRQAAFAEGGTYAGKDYEDLKDSQRIAFEKQIKQNVKSDLSQYPQTELFIYRDGKVSPDTQLKTGAYYNEDIYNFLYQFATTKDKRDSLNLGWAGSELQRQDQRIRSAVATGNTEGLSEDEIKQVNFIKSLKNN